jgi:hypothetical protein
LRPTFIFGFEKYSNPSMLIDTTLFTKTQNPSTLEIGFSCEKLKLHWNLKWKLVVKERKSEK